MSGKISSDVIGQVNAPGEGQLLDVKVSGPFPDTGLWRIDLIEADGDYAGMPWAQIGKNYSHDYMPYELPDNNKRYALLKDYAELEGYASLLIDAGLVTPTGRMIEASAFAFLIECYINDLREFALKCEWSLFGVMNVMASNYDEAVEIAHANADLPNGDYIDDSFRVVGEAEE